MFLSQLVSASFQSWAFVPYFVTIVCVSIATSYDLIVLFLFFSLSLSLFISLSLFVSLCLSPPIVLLICPAFSTFGPVEVLPRFFVVFSYFIALLLNLHILCIWTFLLFSSYNKRIYNVTF